MKNEDIEKVFAALCCWREARGESNEVKIAQICVVRNRVLAHWINDRTYQDVCCHPWQFSGMTAKGDANLVQFPKSKDPAWLACLAAADSVVFGTAEDYSKGAVFYHDISISEPPHVWGPVTETTRIGRLVFYRAV